MKSTVISLPVLPPNIICTIPKLIHDIEQFEYLIRKGIVGNEFVTIVEYYESLINQLKKLGKNAKRPLNSKDRKKIGHVYNRIVHMRSTPKTENRIWGKWDPVQIENQYLSKPLGLVIIDDFLSKETLESIRLFCLESTVWFANRYAYGRLGAFFQEGFNCPLLLQIAQELKKAMPRVITKEFPLRQLWGFKNDSYLPAGSTTHADFAAVNVNFWITSDEANLDSNSGGLIVYNIDAPLSWDFTSYNYRKDKIDIFLQQNNAKFIKIPYKHNRAIIFNSDLFHASDGLRFKSGYENRRINITMLYGDRENDNHHPNLSRAFAGDRYNNVTSAWRSTSFTKVR
jgi:hypothetical protein